MIECSYCGWNETQTEFERIVGVDGILRWRCSNCLRVFPPPPCPICGSDGSVHADGIMAQFGDYLCPDCGVAFSIQSEDTK